MAVLPSARLIGGVSLHWCGPFAAPLDAHMVTIPVAVKVGQRTSRTPSKRAANPLWAAIPLWRPAPRAESLPVPA